MILLFCPPSSALLSLGLRGGDKLLLFSVAKKGTTGGIQQNLQAEYGDQECPQQHCQAPAAVGVS